MKVGGAGGAGAAPLAARPSCPGLLQPPLPQLTLLGSCSGGDIAGKGNASVCKQKSKGRRPPLGRNWPEQAHLETARKVSSGWYRREVMGPSCCLLRGL